MVVQTFVLKRDQRTMHNKHGNKNDKMYEEIVDEFNKKTLSKSANLVALSKGKCSIENAIN